MSLYLTVLAPLVVRTRKCNLLLMYLVVIDATTAYRLQLQPETLRVVELVEKHEWMLKTLTLVCLVFQACSSSLICFFGDCSATGASAGGPRTTLCARTSSLPFHGDGYSTPALLLYTLWLECLEYLLCTIAIARSVFKHTSTGL